MMRSLEIRLKVTPEGEIILPPLPHLQPGDYNAVLVIEAPEKTAQRAPLQLPIVDLGPWPEGISLRREDLYDDER